MIERMLKFVRCGLVCVRCGTDMTEDTLSGVYFCPLCHGMEAKKK